MEKTTSISAHDVFTNVSYDIGGDNVAHFLEAANRLKDLVRTRGSTVYLVDLPKLGKAIDYAVSYGELKDLPQVFGSWKKGTYILQPLIEQLLSFGFWQDTLDLAPEVCKDLQKLEVELFYSLRQFCYVLKDMRDVECPSRNVQLTVRKFFEVDSSLRLPSIDWSSENWSPPLLQVAFTDGLKRPCDTFDTLDFFQGVCDRLLSCFYMEDKDLFSIVPRHGPGAVAELRRGEDKYKFLTWPEKLQSVFPHEWFSYHNEEAAYDANRLARKGSTKLLKEPSGRLLAVPKSYEKPRLITAEPSSHQYIQGGLLRWLRGRMSPYQTRSIDFLSQTPSKEMAKASSIVNTGFATVDLSMASDRLSCWTVERAFRKTGKLMEALWASRTRRVIDSTGVGSPSDSSAFELRKFAGQGSAVCFPIQTLIYHAACVTSVLMSSGVHPSKVTRKRLYQACELVRVYGDDIILPSSSLPRLRKLLTYLQLEVNEGKTHHLRTSPFRESCGMDALHGVDVTPVYVKSLTLSSKNAADLASWVDVSNNAHESGLWNLASMMKEVADGVYPRLLPTSSHSLACVRFTTFCHGTYGCRERFNSQLQRAEIKALSVQSKGTRVKRGDLEGLLQYFIEEPSPETKWFAGYLQRNRLILKSRWVSAT
jgi:hypothetical protein